MFKKLIIAVLTLGLLLTFSSAAISSDNTEPVFVRPSTNPNAPFYNTPEVPSSSVHQMARPMSPGGQVFNVPAPPTNYNCEDYYAFDTVGGFCYYWPLPTAGADGFLYRFPVPEGQACTLKVAWFYIYGPGCVGTPTINVTIYEDNHGVPGNVIHTVTGTYGTDFFDGWNYIDVSAYNYVVTADWHLEVMVDVAASPGEDLALLTDCGDATGRASYVSGGIYYTGFPYGPGFTFERCCADIPYSECYWQGFIDSWAYIFSLPHPSNCRDGLASLFDIEGGPETLKVAMVGLYDYGYDDGSVVVDVNVYDEDGGLPSGAPLATVTLTTMAEKYPASGYAECDFSPFNLVLREDFFIAVEIHSANPGARTYLWGDIPSDYPGRSAVHFPSSNLYGCDPVINGWYTTMDAFGSWWELDIFAYMCKDEYSQCKYRSDYGEPYYILGHRPGSSIKGFAEKLSTSGLDCRVEKIEFQVDPWDGNPGARLSLYDDNSGQPGTELWGTDIDPIVDWWPAWLTANVPDEPYAYVSGNFYIALHGIFHADSFYVDGDHADLGYTNAFAHRLSGGSMIWQPLNVTYGLPINLVARAYTCCVPVAECACAPGEDWPAMGKNYVGRVAHSGNSLGTAQCDYTKAWQYTSGQVAVYNSPVIYKDTVIYYTLDRLVAIDINTGAIIWLRTSDPFEIGDGCYSTPLVKDGIIYTAGGSTQSFNALRVSDGSTVWGRNYSFHNGHFLTFGPSVIIDVGGTNVVIYSDDDGYIYAADAATGANFAGWTTNPVILPSAVNRGLTTDGNLVFIGTDMPNASTDGDIFALDPADGSIVWQLSTSGGLQGSLVVPAKDFGGAEGFTAGISVASGCVPGNLADNVLYTASYYEIADNSSPVQDGGVLYSINAADGSVNWAVLCQQGNYTIPIIDAARVIYQEWTPWISSGQLRGPSGFNRVSGSLDWANTMTNPPGVPDFAIMEGVLSCEEEAPDIFAGIYRSNYVKFFNADNGLQTWHRRFTGYLNNVFSGAGHRIAPVMDEGHLLLPWRNKLICLAPDVSRPRLDIVNYVIDVPVPFDSGNPSRITFENAICNSGCADLTIDSLILDENSNNTNPRTSMPFSSVNEDRLGRLNSLTDAFNPKTDQRWFSFRDEDYRITDAITSKSVLSQNAAYAPPAYVIGLVSPLPGTLVPGYNADTIDIVVDVNADAITRGYHAMYARVYTDDPDYFLDSARIDGILYGDPNYAVPQIQLGLIGGCLYATERLTFGVGGANHEIIWNSGFLAHGDSTSMQVDGDGSSFWQGALVFAVSRYRVALHSTNWHGTEYYWKSLLADPNCVDFSCPPLLQSNVLIPVKYSADNGASYTNGLYANVVSFAYVDSVQNMDDDTSAALHWVWSYPNDYQADPPYDDTLTMGFHVCGQALGVLDVPALSQFTVHKLEVSSRYGQTISNLGLGAMLDYDIHPVNTNQNNGYDAAHSVAWVFDYATPTYGWGAVKVPFGCGYEPLRYSLTIEADQGGPWNDSDLWLDSVYIWMNKTGLQHEPNTYQMGTGDDRDAWFTFQKETITGSEPKIYGFALFGMPNITNADEAATYYPISNLINQFCGFGRGDVNSDNAINLVDIVYLAYYVADPVTHRGPYPFWHLGDVNNDTVINSADVDLLIDFYFNFGACPSNEWMF
jgi:hypothetical protein